MFSATRLTCSVKASYQELAKYLEVAPRLNAYRWFYIPGAILDLDRPLRTCTTWRPPPEQKLIPGFHHQIPGAREGQGSRGTVIPKANLAATDC
ncbi:unnamed protein product [Nezara viridula]|uniref:Uncharacterized protein n=1 Tax=Nezara viridula TaxID=85310 RepID=A0A9P0MXQ5_NEZVI|nr:unnamed protein product [Nezara viridula]